MLDQQGRESSLENPGKFGRYDVLPFRTDHLASVNALTYLRSAARLERRFAIVIEVR